MSDACEHYEILNTKIYGYGLSDGILAVTIVH